MLTNILGNAAKFTEKGKIRIETSRASNDSNNLIEIRISDAGGGIPEEILPRLFEKFATKDVGGSAKHGTGLGLYISKAIVKAHNGKISAFNNPESGATFVISLPIEQGRQGCLRPLKTGNNNCTMTMSRRLLPHRLFLLT